MKLFTTESNAKSTRQLDVTKVITPVADQLAQDIINVISNDEDKWMPLVEAVREDTSTVSLQKMLDESKVMDGFEKPKVDIDRDGAEHALKSYQSKRSRARKKADELNGFKALLSAYISEVLIRDLGDIQPGRTVHSVTFSPEPFSQEEVDEYAANQKRLVAMIRNLQSRKTKAKKSDDTVLVEQIAHKISQLNEVRTITTSNTKTAELNEIKSQFEDLNIDKIKLADAKELLKTIYNIAHGITEETPVEESTEE